MSGNPTISFVKHYIEMVLVMLAGMFVLGGAAIAVGAAFGVSYTEMKQDAPALVLAGMGVSMTAPMVWWMRRRGHSASANGAMAAAMMLPALAMVGLLATETVTSLHSLLMIEHIVMFPLMLVAMLPFRSEFTHAHAAIKS
jgi:flagellar biosynthetic protein FliP